MVEPLKLLSAPVMERLSKNIPENADRYRSGDFLDLARGNGWAIETSLAKWDPLVAAQLSHERTAEAEVANSLLIWNAMTGMTPALAREERLWARLCHVECLSYARARWINGDEVVRDARLHFFASGLRGCRDRNAVGRLWWNAHVAALAMPDDIGEGLRRLLSRANTRLQIVDRADSAFRQPLVAGIFRLLGSDAWFNSYDAAIADFMYEVNKRCGGVIFEAMAQEDTDALLGECARYAKARRSAVPARTA